MRTGGASFVQSCDHFLYKTEGETPVGLREGDRGSDTVLVPFFELLVRSRSLFFQIFCPLYVSFLCFCAFQVTSFYVFAPGSLKQGFLSSLGCKK